MNLTEIAIVIVVALGLGSGAYLVGHRDGREACEARVQVAVDKQKAEDALTVHREQQRADQIDKDRIAAEREVADYAARLAARPRTPQNAGCILDKANADEINR